MYAMAGGLGLLSHIFPLFAILVLNLVDENIASVADLMLRNNFGHLRKIWSPGIRVSGVIVP
jgi:hypothetical protein